MIVEKLIFPSSIGSVRDIIRALSLSMGTKDQASTGSACDIIRALSLSKGRFQQAQPTEKPLNTSPRVSVAARCFHRPPV